MSSLPSDTTNPALDFHPERRVQNDTRRDTNAQRLVAHRQQAAMTAAGGRPFEAYLTQLVVDAAERLPTARPTNGSLPSCPRRSSLAYSTSSDPCSLAFPERGLSGSAGIGVPGCGSSSVLFPTYQPLFPYGSAFRQQVSSSSSPPLPPHHHPTSLPPPSPWPPLLSEYAVHHFHFPHLFPHPRSMAAMVAGPTTTPIPSRGGQRFFFFGGRSLHFPRSDFFEFVLEVPSVEQKALDKVWIQIRKEDDKRFYGVSLIPPSGPSTTSSPLLSVSSPTASSLSPRAPSPLFSSSSSQSPLQSTGTLSERAQDLNQQWFQARNGMMLSYLELLSRQTEEFYSRVSLSPHGLCASAVQWMKTAED